MSVTFTKLFSSITESTVWCEPDTTRITWIAMLAMADRMGRVWATIPGLANRARVSVAACETAINTFLSPDRYSRTEEHEGRRVEKIEGGWRLLNYSKYRDIRDEESIKESKRRYINERRAKEKAVNSEPVEKVDICRSLSIQAEAEAEAEAEAYTPPNDRGLPIARGPNADDALVLIDTQKIQEDPHPTGPDPESQNSRVVVIASLIRSLERGRGKVSRINPSNGHVIGWVEKGVTLEQIRTAYDIAVACRERDGDITPVTSGYIDAILPSVISPPKKRYNRSWIRTQEGIDAKSRELGMLARGGENYDAFAARLEAEDRRRNGESEIDKEQA